jgi:transketolase
VRQSDKDVACVVAAGVTLHEALKAYEILSQKNVFISVIDLYSVKPLDAATVISVAKSCQNRIIAVEDHYPEGGIGEALLRSVSYEGQALHGENITIQSLAVQRLPRSGKPEELLAFAGIDADAIISAVRSF